ncbi:MAG: hypothetical protein MUF54_00520 [Polyangiaceae bacterium]|jgi:hypothetical protein|nr:hypothetical protein [Polyangiaceae bacterium]
MSIDLCIKRNHVSGTVAIAIPPGTVAATRERLVDAVLTAPLSDAASSLGAVLAADPHAYAHPLDGHDELGRTRFEVEGRVEGDRLMPIRKGKRRPKKR